MVEFIFERAYIISTVACYGILPPLTSTGELSLLHSFLARVVDYRSFGRAPYSSILGRDVVVVPSTDRTLTSRGMWVLLSAGMREFSLLVVGMEIWTPKRERKSLRPLAIALENVAWLRRLRI